MNKNYTIEDCRKAARDKKGKCISKKYINCKSNLLWECEIKHQWEAPFDRIKSGHWCPYCAGKAKHTIEKCRSVAEGRNGSCLSEEYVGVFKKMLWECHDGHKWWATFNDIKNNKSWCPYCVGNMPLSIDDCCKVANERNGKCLSEEYINNHSKLLWECEFGHQWLAHLNSVKDNKRWCPYCAGKHKWSIEKCIEIAKGKGGQCLSSEYISVETKMLWKCNLDHQWEAILANVLRGHWCPTCKNKSQQKLLYILQDIYKTTPLSNHTFGWLKNNDTGGTMQIDIWIPHLKLAIEYDGEQHFMPIRFGGIPQEEAGYNFKEQMKRDQLKNKLIAQHPEEIRHFIRFNYTEEIEKEYVMSKIAECLGEKCQQK